MNLILAPVIVAATVFAAALALSAQAPTPSPIVFRIATSSYYHLQNCPISKGRQTTPIPFSEARANKIEPCPVCTPERSPSIIPLLAAEEAVRRAAENAAREKAAVDRATAALAAREAAAKKAEEDKLAAIAERNRPVVRLTALQARTIAANVVKEMVEFQKQPAVQASQLSAMSNTMFRMMFREIAKKAAPHYTGDPVDLLANDDISVVLFGPTVALELLASEKVRKMEPLGVLPWVAVGTIRVTARTISSPNIEKVVLQKDGVIVPAVTSSLAPVPNATRMGAKFTVNEGVVVFPLSAFDPKATVSITLIPTTGENVLKVLSDAELRSVQ